MARYHANALSTIEVIQELIKLAQDMRAAAERGEAEGLSQEERAFYDALAPGPNKLKGLVIQLSGAPGDAASRSQTPIGDFRCPVNPSKKNMLCLDQSPNSTKAHPSVVENPCLVFVAQTGTNAFPGL